MSREICSYCKAVVSTTADPNDLEGWFVTLEDVERLEVLGENAPKIFCYLRTLLKRLCLRIVICYSCREKLAR